MDRFLWVRRTYGSSDGSSKEVSSMREIEIKPVPVQREERRTGAFLHK